MSAPLIHIGFHKTGTTLLQERLFVETRLGFHFPEYIRSKVHQAFINPIGLDAIPENLVQHLTDELTQARRDAKTLVLSHERLSGYPASGGFDQSIIADRLHSIFPESRILILIREQKKMILSMYLQSISDGSPLSLARFLKHPESNLLRQPGFDFGYYEYDRVISKYQALFGKKNVLVIPFEALVLDAASEARKIVCFSRDPLEAQDIRPGLLDEKMNRARPLALQAFRRILNRFFRSQLNQSGTFSIQTSHVDYVFETSLALFEFLRPLDPPIKRKLQSQVEDACQGRYQESNRRTQLMIDADLSALGYDL